VVDASPCGCGCAVLFKIGNLEFQIWASLFCEFGVWKYGKKYEGVLTILENKNVKSHSENEMTRIWAGL